jgi:hypothetical protein
MIRTIIGFDDPEPPKPTPSFSIPTDYSVPVEAGLKQAGKIRKREAAVIKGHPCIIVETSTAK